MKKVFNALLLLLLFIPSFTLAEAKTYDDITYSEVKDAFKELMKDYYIKGPNIQYNYAKVTYGIDTPEEATAQDMKYAVCGAYTYDVISEAFGMTAERNPNVYYFPKYADGTIDTSRYLYYIIKNDTSKLNKLEADDTVEGVTKIRTPLEVAKKELIYYENTENNLYYVSDSLFPSVTGEISFSTFVKKIRPGDLFTYSGHAMIAYDIIDTDGDGVVDDVLMLNSAQQPTIKTRITGTARLSHNVFKSEHGKNGYLDISNEGTIQYFWLSERSYFAPNGKSGKIKCSSKVAECSVIRLYNKSDDTNSSGNELAIFNYNINPNQYKKAQLRMDYPGLSIEKTVDKGDNNSVFPQQELVYTIAITNNSNVTYDGKTYGAFTIEETIDDNATYLSADSNAIVSGNKIMWQVASLTKNTTITLTYSVRVNSISSAPIQAQGKFYKTNKPDVYITTGTVSNPVVLKQFSAPTTDKYSACYEEHANDDFSSLDEQDRGLALVQTIFECVASLKDENGQLLNEEMYNMSQEIDFTTFKFKNIFTKKDRPLAKGNSNAITFKSDMGPNAQKFKNMILNNYWSGLTVNNTNADNDSFNANDNYITLPRWSGKEASLRNKTIMPGDFKTGDILIYYINYSKLKNSSNDDSLYMTTPDNIKFTDEGGMYAYTYINGKFQGINYPNSTKERNKFTYNYYSSDYAKLYDGYDKLTSNQSEEQLKFANFQTLFDKDYYVILRPSIMNIDLQILGYKTNNSKQTIYDINKYTQINDLLPNITTNGTIIGIFDKSNNSVSGIAKTGYFVRVTYGSNENTVDYKISVRGDVTGDGEVNNIDATEIAKHIIDKNYLANEYEIAAYYNEDDAIKMNDVMQILKDN